eukprot:CAMPEP_0205909442 /NCGR_PEP_ID=MMETSP1325-20131115/3879_1 /ASSEMBLY_ACC=CAM_ASM_000708 /TAXON_ID=236786 /ORGANISM="Florenciella sp., Strain RCC1007" /LENGTH=97 /DNA_ID=CAMNT_0053275733 /DNA_START=20 /DNA_END=310 /DNA_ORIENTATION=+
MQKFDLKGSLLKRYVTDEERDAGVSVLKDLNFCQHHNGTDNKGNTIKALPGPCRKLRIGKLRWSSFVANIMNDVDFLRAHNIMDYSLLLGTAPVPTD